MHSKYAIAARSYSIAAGNHQEMCASRRSFNGCRTQPTLWSRVPRIVVVPDYHRHAVLKPVNLRLRRARPRGTAYSIDLVSSKFLRQQAGDWSIAALTHCLLLPYGLGRLYRLNSTHNNKNNRTFKLECFARGAVDSEPVRRTSLLDQPGLILEFRGLRPVDGFVPDRFVCAG